MIKLLKRFQTVPGLIQSQNAVYPCIHLQKMIGQHLNRNIFSFYWQKFVKKSKTSLDNNTAYNLHTKIYRFSTKKQQQKKYLKTEKESQNKNSQNSQKSKITKNENENEETDNVDNIQKQDNGRKFINRIKNYSQFLANKSQNKTQNTSILSTDKLKQKMINDLNQHFIEAGTTTKQISESLGLVAEKLTKMFNQSQMLYNKNKGGDEKQYLKYKRRYQQFIRLLNRLDKQHYKQPNILNNNSIQTALFLLDLQTQMNSLIQLLYGSIQEHNPYFRFNPDITNDDPFSKNFEYAWSKVKIIQLDAAKKARHDIIYDLLRKSVIMVTNAVVNEHTWSSWNNQYWQKIIFGLSFPVSLTNLQKAQLHCYKLWRKPNIGMVKNLLDLPQKGYIQHAKKIIYPTIKSNFFLYNHTAAKSTSQSKKSVNTQQVNAQQTTSNIFQKSQNSGRILLNAHEDLFFKGAKPVGKFDKIKSLLSFNKNQQTKQIPPKQRQTVIIHIHGGGFISMSSQLTQNHTRKWAKQLNIPVFSLDYRKPPKHRFPEPLQDCVAGYKFIVEKIHKYMNVQPKNIIVAGDSAGGNMACALQIQLMKQKYPILPKALLLMYPAVDLRIRYTASRLNSLNDGIFLPSLLMLCQEQYLGKDRKNQFDPLASPILLTESYLDPSKKQTKQGQKWPQNWPKTVIMAGRKDPLFDDSIRLLQRLTKDSIDCKMLLYKDFSHGFMSMDQVLPGAKEAINDSITQLRDIITKFK